MPEISCFYAIITRLYAQDHPNQNTRWNTRSCSGVDGTQRVLQDCFWWRKANVRLLIYNATDLLEGDLIATAGASL